MLTDLVSMYTLKVDETSWMLNAMHRRERAAVLHARRLENELGKQRQMAVVQDGFIADYRRELLLLGEATRQSHEAVAFATKEVRKNQKARLAAEANALKINEKAQELRRQLDASRAATEGQQKLRAFEAAAREWKHEDGERGGFGWRENRAGLEACNYCSQGHEGGTITVMHQSDNMASASTAGTSPPSSAHFRGRAESGDRGGGAWSVDSAAHKKGRHHSDLEAFVEGLRAWRRGTHSDAVEAALSASAAVTSWPLARGQAYPSSAHWRRARSVEAAHRRI